MLAKLFSRVLPLLLVSLVACARSAEVVPTPEPTVAPTPAAPSAPLVLTIWHSWSGRSAQALDQLARRYEQGHPGVRIRLQAHPAATLVRDYSAGVADGSAPQILLVLSRYVGELAERRHILPLSEEVVAASLPDLLPAALDGARVSGALHGLPLSYDSLALFYDRRMLPDAPASFEQLLAFTPPPVEPPVDQRWGLGYFLSPATTAPYLRMFGGAIFDERGAIALDGDGRDGTVRWLEWLQTLRADERALVTDDFSEVDAMVQANRVASVIDWIDRRQAYEQLWGAEAVGIAPLPRLPGQDAVPPSMVLVDVMCINTVTTAPQRDASIDFLLYLTGSSAQELLWTRGGQVPANQRARVEGAAKEAMAISSNGMPFPHSAHESSAWPTLDTMLRSVLDGSATPAEALDTAATGLRALEAGR